MAVSTIDALYNGTSEKLTTSATGIDVTGTVTSDGLTVTQSGSTTATIGATGTSGDNDGTLIINNGGTGDGMLRFDYESNTDRARIGVSASSQNLQFYTAGNNERMRITSSGNVGVGTSSPSSSYKVTIDSDESMIRMNHTGTGTNGNLDLAVNSTVATINANYSTTAIDLRFLTGAQERMRITSAGAKNFGVHQSESGGFNIFAGAGSTASFAARFEGTGTGASNVVQITNGYGEVGSIKIASNGTTTNYNTGSDYRLKTDVQPVTDASARIQSLNPVNFEWIRSGTRTDGFLAHEAQSVVPDCVSGDKDAMKDEGYEVTPATGDIYTPATEAYVDDDGNNVDAVDKVIHSADVEQPETLEDGQQWRETTAAVMGTRSVPDYQGIDQSKLVPLLTAALQEALAKIDAMETRLTALEG